MALRGRDLSGFSLERAELLVKAISYHVKWAGERHCEMQLGWRLDSSVPWCLWGRGAGVPEQEEVCVQGLRYSFLAFAHSP